MSLIKELLPVLKRHVNAVEFDSDDALLETNLKRGLSQLLSVCNIKLDDVYAISEMMSEDELECGLPADFAGAVLELAAAMYRYGEAYSESVYRLTPSFNMVTSRYRKHFDPYKEEEDQE